MTVFVQIMNIINVHGKIAPITNLKERNGELHNFQAENFLGLEIRRFLISFSEVVK